MVTKRTNIMETKKEKRVRQTNMYSFDLGEEMGPKVEQIAKVKMIPATSYIKIAVWEAIKKDIAEGTIKEV